MSGFKIEQSSQMYGPLKSTAEAASNPESTSFLKYFNGSILGSLCTMFSEVIPLGLIPSDNNQPPT